MKFNHSVYLHDSIPQRKIKLLIKPIFIIILLNITKITCTEGELMLKNSTALIKENPNNAGISRVNWEKLNSTMLNLINILDSLIESTDKNSSDRDILALEFVRKNRELQSQLKFLDRNKNFLSKRRKLKSFMHPQANENRNLQENNAEGKQDFNNFNTNIKIKNTVASNNNNQNSIENNNLPIKNNNEAAAAEEEEEDEQSENQQNNNVFFIENKNTFSAGSSPNSSVNEFNLQIQFSNGINKHKVSQKSFFSNNINIENKVENSNDDSNSINYNQSNKINSNQNQNNYNTNYNNNENNKQIRNFDSPLAEDSVSKSSEKKILRKLKNHKLFGLNYVEFLLKDKFRYAKNVKCNEFNCFSPSVCLDEGICKCGEEFANFAEAKNDKEFTIYGGKDSEPTVHCSYKRKKQIVTFMLEFFLFFGMGHVYSGNYIIGFSKFVFFVLLIVLKLKSKKSQKEIEIEEEEGNNRNKKINWAHLLILLLAVIWYLVDIIFLALSKYIDGNGVPMLSW